MLEAIPETTGDIPMKIQMLACGLIVATAFACGTARPDPNDYIHSGNAPVTAPAPASKSSQAASPTAKPDTGAAPATSKPAADAQPKAAAPAATPPAAAAKLPIRTLVNAAETATAKTDYASNCAGCHQPLATSAKKAATLPRIVAAGMPTGKPGAVPAHQTLVSGNKWPVDVADATDDGVDTASLKASAMVEALK